MASAFCTAADFGKIRAGVGPSEFDRMLQSLGIPGNLTTLCRRVPRVRPAAARSPLRSWGSLTTSGDISTTDLSVSEGLQRGPPERPAYLYSVVEAVPAWEVLSEGEREPCFGPSTPPNPAEYSLPNYWDHSA